jgi:glycosyltransferase involved in cell wall biosynthesis
MPIFSIIVPTCDRNDLLAKCLCCLAPGTQTLDRDKYEVIVSDDSKDNIAKTLIEKKFPWAKWIQGSKRGPASNRNNGAKCAKGEWLVFIDDDCLPDIDLLKKYEAAISESEARVFEGKVLADRNQERFDEHSPLNMYGGNFWSCNFAIEKQLFQMIHGFDENFPFPAMEDIDLYKRIKEIANVLFIDSAYVVHPWRRMKPFNNYNKWIISHHYFLNKYGIERDFSFRWSRFKIFVSECISSVPKLISFKFKGTGFFLEKNMFNFLMILK